MSEDNPLSDYLDKQIKESATRIHDNETTLSFRFDTPLKVTHQFPLWECIVAGMGLTVGIFGTFGVCITIDKYIWPAIKQFLGV